jgi:arylsulfatase A-like enzyme
MTGTPGNFRAVVFSLWLRLITLCSVALLVAAAPELPQMIENWRLYQTAADIVFGVVVRAVFVSIAGAVLGTVLAALSVPFLLLRSAPSRERAALLITRILVVAAAFWDLSILVKTLVQPVVKSVGLMWFPTMIIYTAAFAIALFLPRSRKQIVTSLDGLLEEKSTRRAALAIGVAAAGMVAAEWTIGKVSRPAKAARTSRPAGPNILLITFDALSAEDMSVYGYRLPTTPHISEFSARSSVFTNFYSASTFTTPSVATILTGAYPSDHRVYHLQGRLSGEYARQTLPAAMRAGGYATGASISNPFAYFLAQGIAGDYDIFPAVPFRPDDYLLWRATAPLHQRQPPGNRAREFGDVARITNYLPRVQGLEGSMPRLFGRTESEFPPEASFAQARKVIDQLPDGYFMWVHVWAPHAPYLPAPPQLGRFLPGGEMRREWDQRIPEFYPPEAQPLVDKARLRYDEFILECDRTFGSFLSGIETAGRLDNTAVIVAADHGESFEGQNFTHDGPSQTRPKIHVPLIIRMPGQREGRRLAIAADQTRLAPTLLDIAGVKPPASMRGESLLPLLNSKEDGDSGGLAFSQYLATNTIFEPPRAGTVGVIDGQHQYVFDLATGKGILRELSEAQSWNLDRSAENPALAQKLRQIIHSKFPDLRKIPA